MFEPPNDRAEMLNPNRASIDERVTVRVFIVTLALLV